MTVVGVAGHAYPWDVLGDPDFAGRTAGLSVDTVVLAAAYHSVRAATPLHPEHQMVEAGHAALYRPVRPEVWRGRRLVPGAQNVLDSPDPFGTAADRLTSAGFPVSAWIVLTHSTRLGTAYPDVAVVNCFGEPYRYALCPARAEVRDYAALLAAEAVRDAPVAEVSLEGCGQLGVAHAGCHDKTAGAWPDAAARLLSICCCGACRSVWRGSGFTPETIVDQLRAGVRAAVNAATAGASRIPTPSAGGGAPAGRSADGGPAGHSGLDPALLAALLAARQRATDALRAQVLAALHEAAPGARVVLHADPDPWATGPLPGLTPGAAADVDAVLVSCWSTGADSIERVAAAAMSPTPVEAYVTVLPPTDPVALPAHTQRLRAAGVRRINLYHLGLAPAELHTQLATLARALRIGPRPGGAV